MSGICLHVLNNLKHLKALSSLSISILNFRFKPHGGTSLLLVKLEHDESTQTYTHESVFNHQHSILILHEPIMIHEVSTSATSGYLNNLNIFNHISTNFTGVSASNPPAGTSEPAAARSAWVGKAQFLSQRRGKVMTKMMVLFSVDSLFFRYFYILRRFIKKQKNIS